MSAIHCTFTKQVKYFTCPAIFTLLCIFSSCSLYRKLFINVSDRNFTVDHTVFIWAWKKIKTLPNSKELPKHPKEVTPNQQLGQLHIKAWGASSNYSDQAKLYSFHATSACKGIQTQLFHNKTALEQSCDGSQLNTCSLHVYCGPQNKSGGHRNRSPLHGKVFQEREPGSPLL